MLRRISSNKDSFRPITFKNGFNVILAERSPDATDQHSRNARGKTTLLHVISFCLGGTLHNSMRPLVEDEWSFTLDIDLFGSVVTATRPLKGATKLTLEYDGDAAVVLDDYVDGDRQIK